MPSPAESPAELGRTAIIGGGATGLRLGLELARRGGPVTVLEQAPVIGGLASSFPLDGVQLERYYHFLCRHDGPLLRLVDELGLGARVRWRPTAMEYFIRDRLWPFSTAMDLLRFRPLSLRNRLRFGASVLWIQNGRRWHHLDSLTAREWVLGLCGNSGYDVIWRPLLEKKFGVHADRISAAWLWGRTRRRARSKRGFPPHEELGYLEGGSHRLFEAMAAQIRATGGEIRTSWPVTRIAEEGDGLRVESPRGNEVFPRVASTVPFPILLDLAPELPAPYRERLARQEYFHVICPLLVFDRPLGRNYWVNIYDREIPFIGVIEFTHLNPLPDLGGKTVVYLPAYLPEEDPTWAMDDGELTDLFLSALGRIYPGLERMRRLNTYVFRDRYAQPICRQHHRDSILGFETPWPRLFVGDASQIFPEDRGVNNAFRLAVRLAERILGEP
jgi:protoporphyrinogen oxidase